MSGEPVGAFFFFSFTSVLSKTHFLCSGADLGSRHSIFEMKITIRLFIYSSFRLSTTHHRWLPLISGLVIGPPVGDITSRGNPLILLADGKFVCPIVVAFIRQITRTSCFDFPFWYFCLIQTRANLFMSLLQLSFSRGPRNLIGMLGFNLK